MAFKGVLLEGLEVAFSVLTFGANPVGRPPAPAVGGHHAQMETDR
jgi:uncharacterized membrane protein